MKTEIYIWVGISVHLQLVGCCCYSMRLLFYQFGTFNVAGVTIAHEWNTVKLVFIVLNEALDMKILSRIFEEYIRDKNASYSQY